jgi:hypothetical protein
MDTAYHLLFFQTCQKLVVSVTKGSNQLHVTGLTVEYSPQKYISTLMEQDIIVPSLPIIMKYPKC